MLKKAISIFQKHGFAGALKVVKNKLFREKMPGFQEYRSHLKNKQGIEIGGPSPFFDTDLPIYSVITSCDGVNFNQNTVWEGQIREGKNYAYKGRKLGYQFICDAVELNTVADQQYDFVLSCNNLEHIANPLKAIKEWLRILKPKAYLLLVLPYKNTNFDHRRDYTHFSHLLDDFRNDTKEDDLTHLEEILEKHDLTKDHEAGSFENFRARSLKNFENRCLHHHVFSEELLKEIYRHFGLEIVLSQVWKRDIIILGKKPGASQ